MRTILSIAVDALAYGMALFVICIGLSLTMGLMRVINLAHGVFAMTGGTLASLAMRRLGVGYGAATLLAVLGTVILAVPLERFLFRRIYGASPMMQILLTIGVAFSVVGIADYLFGPTLKTIPLPPLLSRPVDLGFRTIAVHKLFVIACGLVTAGGLWILIAKTAFGIRLRAAIDNAAMTDALGIRTQTLYAIASALAAGLGALGGVIGAEFFPIEPAYALRYMVTFLVVVSVGGAGSIPGALLASLLLGAIDTAGRYFVPDFGGFFFYAAVTLIVCLFPHGLLGKAR